MEEQQQHNTPHRPPVDRRSVAQLLMIGVIVSLGGIAAGLAINWFPTQASSQAHEIDTLYNVLIVATVPIFVLVETVVLFAVVRFRMRPGEELLDGPPIHGSTRLEIVWTAGPSALIAALVVYGFIVLGKIEKKPAHEMQVNVNGQQFAWSFQYPASGPGATKVVSDELYLPIGESVKFNIRSSDVLHAFWVPAFRIQEDAVPGVTTTYRITPTRLGSYDIICNELCGLGHSLMRSTVHVVTPAAFREWMAQRGASATVPAGASLDQVAATGKKVFTGSGGCGACHTLADAGTQGGIGPNLNKFLKRKSTAFIRTSVVDPSAYIEKGFGANIMPGNYSQTLTKDEVAAVVQYLAKVTNR